MKRLILALIFLLLVAQVNAQKLDLEYNIEYDKVLVNYKFYNTQSFKFELPSDSSAVSFYINQRLIEIDTTENLINIPEASAVELSFLTKSPLESSGSNIFFLVDLNFPEALQSRIKLTLPEEAILSKPFNQGSVYPQPTRISTDGQHVIIEWDKLIAKDQSFSIFVIFKEHKTYAWLLIPLIAVIIVLLVLLKKKPKIKKVITRQPVKLKPEERRIVDILKQKGGECEQATLRLITEYPKATLSRILKELDQRDIIKKISKGKKNIITLK